MQLKYQNNCSFSKLDFEFHVKVSFCFLFLFLFVVFLFCFCFCLFVCLFVLFLFFSAIDEWMVSNKPIQDESYILSGIHENKIWWKSQHIFSNKKVGYYKVSNRPILSVYLVCRILHEFVQKTPAIEDKKDLRDLQDVTQRLLEACSEIAGKSNHGDLEVDVRKFLVKSDLLQ